MDEALSRELQLFKKRKNSNLQTSTNDKNNVLFSNDNESTRKRKSSVLNTKSRASSSLNKNLLPPQILNSLKKTQAKLKGNIPLPINEQNIKNKYYCSSKTKSGILACIVDFLKDTFFKEMELVSENKKKLEECQISFTLFSILDKTQNLNTCESDKNWLLNTALPNNPRITVNGDKFQYKPIHDVYDRKSLLKLLENYNDNGYGGILIDDIRDSAVNADHLILALRNKMFHISRINDKKDVIFYFDPQYVMGIEEDLVSLWKSINIESIDDRGIEKYLSMANISCFSSANVSNPCPQKEVKKKVLRGRQAKVHNVHLSDGILKDYNF